MSIPTEKRLLVVDDHPIVHEGLVQLLSSDPRLNVCGHVADAAKALESTRALRPDLIILDLSLRGCSGLDLIKNLHTFFPQLPVLVFSMRDEVVYAERALRAGARGYVMKMHSCERMREAIHRLLAGEIYLSDAMVKRSVRRFAGDAVGSQSERYPVETLSDREFQVLQRLGQGMNTRTVADELHISVKTVESHRMHLKEKLGLPDSQALVRFAIQWIQHGSGEH